MQKDKFNDKAQCPVEIQFSQRASTLNESHHIGFRELKQRQDSRRVALLDRLDKERDTNIREYTQEFLDQSITQNSLTLKPKHLRLSRDQLKEQAHIDATRRVDYEQMQVLDRFEARTIEAQHSYLLASEHSERLGNAFTKAGPENSIDKGGHER